MAQFKFLQGACEHCGGGIRYPAEQVGTMVACPHCGKQTELQLLTPKTEPAIPTRMIVWTVVAVLILAGGLAGALLALKRARNLAERKQAAQAGSPAPSRPAAILFSPVPGDFQVTTVTVERAGPGQLPYGTGTVSNSLDRARARVRIELEVMDATGRRIGGSMDSIDEIGPHGLKPFRAPLLKAEAASAKVTAITERKP
jgi:hypothetical protein